MRQAGRWLLSLIFCCCSCAAESASGVAVEPGEGLYLQKCGICHLPGRTGAQMLERRLGLENAHLHERRDLQDGYIAVVVRQGLAGMPPLTRVELPDRELQLIIRYLTRSPATRGRQP